MDIISDQNPTALYEVGIRAGDKLPQYVKEASVLQPEDVVDLKDFAFADQANRLHPIHTKAATYLSAVYLAAAGLDNTPAFTAAKKAASAHGISEDVDYALTLIPKAEKSASEDKPLYALEFDILDDHIQAFPLNTEVQVYKSACDIDSLLNKGMSDVEWLTSATMNLVKRAKELRMSTAELPARIWRLGEERNVDFAKAADAVCTRSFAGVSDVSQYEEAVKSAAEGSISVDEALRKWADLDMINGLGYRNMLTPKEAFHSGYSMEATVKFANENVHISGVLVPMVAVKKLAAENIHIKRAFRKENAEQIISLLEGEKSASELSSSLATLPVAHQKEILNLLLAVA